MGAAAKQSLSESYICTKYITPALVAAGKWDLMSQIREEVYFTKGRVLVSGKRHCRANTVTVQMIPDHGSVKNFKGFNLVNSRWPSITTRLPASSYKSVSPIRTA